MSTHFYAAMVEDDMDTVRFYGIAALGAACAMPVSGALAIADIMIEKHGCQAAFSQARGVPVGTHISVTVAGKDNAQGHPECHATGVDKNGRPVTFIWNNNGKPPRAAGLAFGS